MWMQQGGSASLSLLAKTQAKSTKRTAIHSFVRSLAHSCAPSTADAFIGQRGYTLMGA